MNEDFSDITRASLIVRVADPNDKQAWDEFASRYGARIFGWCRRWGLSEHDAEDVAQEVMRKLVTVLSGFQYDPGKSFRAWLRTITSNTWKDFLRDRQRRLASANLSAIDAVTSDEFVKEMESELDREWLEFAMRDVQKQVSPRDWGIFQALSLQERAGKEVAAEYEVKIGTAYVISGRVKRLLEQRLSELDSSANEPRV